MIARFKYLFCSELVGFSRNLIDQILDEPSRSVSLCILWIIPKAAMTEVQGSEKFHCPFKQAHL
jgi:hypothetical protein